MTAEIAIINKTAVALATDSAVTITTGARQEKIFDSADKLFELCNHNPIGIMIYNGMSFAETPLPSLIKLFRNQSIGHEKVEDAAKSFLKFLQEYGASAPQNVKNRHLFQLISPTFTKIRQESNKTFEQELQAFLKASKNAGMKEISGFRNEITIRIANNYIRILELQKPASFLGKAFGLTKTQNTFIGKCIKEAFIAAPSVVEKKIFEVAKLLLERSAMSDSVTGIVIAGFGRGEVFPTLVSYEIDGIIGSSLKYIETNHVDIDIKDHTTSRATVIPFAQKEMVERFLYGLDEKNSERHRRFLRGDGLGDCGKNAGKN